MLKDRLIIGIGGGALACLVLLSPYNAFLWIIVSAIVIIALTELYSTLGYFKNNVPLTIFGYAAGVAILLSCITFNFSGKITPQAWMLTLIAYLGVLMIYMVLTHGKTTFSDVSSSFVSTVYAALSLSHLILIRNLPEGYFLIWAPVIIAWLSDTMAYTFGMLFGKHKLIPAVSPKKTIEGAIGGVLGGIVFMVIFGIICALFAAKSVNYLNVIILGGLGSVLSQFGDLAASCIKREYNIKDFGNLLPGHGGIVDRFDSVIVVAPFVYYFITLFPIFG